MLYKDDVFSKESAVARLATIKGKESIYVIEEYLQDDSYILYDLDTPDLEPLNLPISEVHVLTFAEIFTTVTAW